MHEVSQSRNGGQGCDTVPSGGGERTAGAVTDRYTIIRWLQSGLNRGNKGIREMRTRMQSRSLTKGKVDVVTVD